MKFHRTRFLILLFILPAFTVTAQGLNPGGPRLAPLPFWVEAGRWEQTLTADQILTAALAASELSPEETSAYREKYGEFRQSLKKNGLPVTGETDDYARGDALLVWMHQNLLSSYNFSQSRMDLLLEKGTFNCVSSSVLYMILARDLGLETTAVETSDHSFCRVITRKGSVDVETTSIYGFDPGVKREFSNEFNQTGFTYVPPGNYRLRRDISDKQLVSLILQNRMAALQRENRPEAVTGIALDRWVFLKTEESRKDLLSVFQNLAADWNQRKRYLESFEMISAVTNLYGFNEETQTLLFQLASNYLNTLLDKNRFAEAREFLSLRSDVLDAARRRELETLIGNAELGNIVQTGDPAEALTAVKTAFDRGLLKESLRRQWTVYLLQKQALDISETSGWWEAYRFLKNLPEPEGSFREMQTMKNQMHQNWTAEIHNRFVDSVKVKDPGTARKILEEGLKQDPGNRILTGDLSDLTRIFP